jgi:hypothetical protein
MRPGVKTDEPTGMPLFVWGSKFPDDLYEERYGVPMLQPIVRGDGGPCIGKSFEIQDSGAPYTAFNCAFLHELHDGSDPSMGPETACGLRERHGEGIPEDISTIRPRNCGEFPVFGLDIDVAILGGEPFIPPTGALPRCTWHGIRIVGPWKEEPAWRERWRLQQVEKQEMLNGSAVHNQR